MLLQLLRTLRREIRAFMKALESEFLDKFIRILL